MATNCVASFFRRFLLATFPRFPFFLALRFFFLGLVNENQEKVPKNIFARSPCVPVLVGMLISTTNIDANIDAVPHYKTAHIGGTQVSFLEGKRYELHFNSFVVLS